MTTDATWAAPPAEAVNAFDVVPRVDELISTLLRASTRLVPDDLAPLLRSQARRCGFEDATIFIVDHEQQVLTPLRPLSDQLSALDIDTTVAGRAFQLERALSVTGDSEEGSANLWLPLLDSAERLGVLHLRSLAMSEELLARCEDVASLVAELLVSKSNYGDSLTLARRRGYMTLAAELRWSQLPPLTFTTQRVGIACVLEPPYEVAGDAFDYAMNDGVLHLLIVDAMGHGLEASRMASLAIAAYRHSRRRQLDLQSTFRAVDEALSTQFGSDRFVTGQLATLDSHTGRLHWLNAGHPRPLLLRQGRVASELACDPSLPLGLGDVPLEIAEVSLEPGDRLLFFTDGVVEASSPEGERFGQDRLVDLTRRALADEQTLSETVRRLVRSVRSHHQGALDDDATILLVDWRRE
ncbi:MAG: serine/threonine-protein phosphatase [Actinomycetota bacterium]|nr:serine/threonine-protein phosphatase [Actinomycetota bacterium]